MHAYLRLVLEKFDCYGTWLPGTRVRVGEIGRLLGGGSFERTGDLNVRLRERPDLRRDLPRVRKEEQPPQEAMVAATVKRGARASVGVGQILQALSDASAAVTLEMAKHNSAALIMEGVKSSQFSDQRVIRRLMSAMRQSGLIDLDEVVITYVMEAASGVVAATSGDLGVVDGAVAGDLGVSKMKLVKLNGKLALSSSGSSETVAVAQRDTPLTPMYRAMSFRADRSWRKFWRKYYTVESLVRVVASSRARHQAEVEGLRGLTSSGRERLRASEDLALDLIGGEASDVVASSVPSLAVAADFMQELGGLEDVGISAAMRSAAALPRRIELDEPGDDLRIATMHASLGQLLLRDGDLVGAREHYEQAVDLAEKAHPRDIPAGGDAGPTIGDG